MQTIIKAIHIISSIFVAISIMLLCSINFPHSTPVFDMLSVYLPCLGLLGVGALGIKFCEDPYYYIESAYNFFYHRY